MRCIAVCTAVCAVLGLVLSITTPCQAWDVTEVYVKVSQDEAGNFTTTTDRPDLWTGPNATWIRGRVRGMTDPQHPGEWPLGQIVRMGPFHEYDVPTRSFNMFYGPAPMGADAYFMHVDTSWDYPSQVYVGTNFFSGMAVKDLVTMRYTAQLTYRAHPDFVASHPNWGQPPMVELNTDSGKKDALGNIIPYTFLYKPWGQNALQTSPPVPGNPWECRWHEIDCHSQAYWRILHISSSDAVGDWSWMLARRQTAELPDKHLVTPLVGKYTDWYRPPGLSLSNPSGTSFSIKLGVPIPTSDNDGYQDNESWACESVDNWGFFDKVVIGVADQRDGGGNVTHETRYTFDFENSTTPVPTMAAMGNAPRKLEIVKSFEDTNLFVLYGESILTDDPYDEDFLEGEYFTLDDGSGAPVKVMCPGHELPMPDGFTHTYVRVEGRLFNLQALDPRFPYYDASHPWRQIHKHIMYSWPSLVTVY